MKFKPVESDIFKNIFQDVNLKKISIDCEKSTQKHMLDETTEKIAIGTRCSNFIYLIFR